MKRILFLTFYFRPDLCAGSFRNSPLLDELSRQTMDENIQIDVFTTSPNRYSSFSRSYLPVEEFGNVRIERIDIPTHKSGMKDQALSFKTYFFETLKKTKNIRYDLVYGSSSRFFTSYLAYRIAKRNNCALYIDVRDIFSETIRDISQNPAFRLLISPFIAQLEKRVYHYATHVNLISKGFKSSFINYPGTSFSYYSHGADPMFINTVTENAWNNKNKLKKILYAGNIGEGQGLHKIIPEAAKRLQGSFEFEIIGDGGAIEKLKVALERKNVSNVRVSKPIKREQLIEKYIHSDILFIHLNDYEIFKKVLPSKIFELAVTGKPILAGVRGYSSEFLQQHVPQSYIFDPGDVNGLMNMVTNIEQEKNDSHSGHSIRFAENFNRKKINKEMAKSITELI